MSSSVYSNSILEYNLKYFSKIDIYVELVLFKIKTGKKSEWSYERIQTDDPEFYVETTKPTNVMLFLDLTIFN